jgi:hypothetical protein
MGAPLRKLALGLVILGASGLGWGQVGVGQAGNKHTLLLAHFNAGLAADYARGDAQPLRVPNRGGAVLQPGRFGSGVCIPTGAFGVAFAGASNFNGSQGTIEFWLQGGFPDPTEDNAQKYYLPFLVCGGTSGTGLAIARTQYNQLSLSISEAYRQTLGIAVGCSGPCRINDGQWHHLAVTWDEEHAAIFVDGRRRAWTETPAYPAASNWGGNLYVGYSAEDDYFYSQSDQKSAFVPHSAQATLDELRVSDCVRYVADFVPPDREFDLVSPDGVGGNLSAIAATALGAPEGIGVHAGEGVAFADAPEGKAAYVHFSSVPGDYLCCRAAGLANRFMGTMACSIRVDWKASDNRRHVLLDLCNRSQTGYLLEKRADGTLCFSAQQNGREQTHAAAPADDICDGKWHTVAGEWHTEGLRLVVDGKPRGHSDQATVVPAALGRELFIGSSYEAVDQLDGAIMRVMLGAAYIRFDGRPDR